MLQGSDKIHTLHFTDSLALIDAESGEKKKTRKLYSNFHKSLDSQGK